ERNRWIFINKEGRRVWGISLEEAMFRPFMDFVHPEDREATLETDRTLRRRKEPVFGFANRQWTTIGWRTYEWNTFPIVDEFGEYRGHQATGRDVSARVEAERRLQRLTNRYTHAERAAGLGHWEMDVETGHSTWSDELFRICGFEPQSFTPTAEIGFSLIHPDDRDTARERVSHTRETGEPYRIETRIVRPSGEVRWVDSRGGMVYDEERRASSLVGSFLDITDRKNVEHELKTALEERDVLMSELNHRVKNNLSLVASLISLKQDAVGGAVDLSDIARHVEAIQLIHEELQMSRHVDRIEFAPYVRDLVTRAMPRASGAGVEIDVDVGEHTLPSSIATTLGLIINELAANAVEHGFTREAENRFSLSFDTDDDAGDYVLTVSNSGPPFPEDVDLHAPSTLGLQLVEALTEQLQGTMSLERSPHPAFTIRCPVTEG
ncbi:MAG: PAS domain-containing protein, partial [Spirochaetes bacterium]|nr:PAS domain-containing protein [Spirochaetota bacterium]